MSVIRDVYLYEFESMPYKERLYYLLNNEIGIQRPEPVLNPLYWCTMDLIHLLRWVIMPASALIVLLLAMNEARLLKSRYKDEDRCVFFSNRKMIK